MVDQSDLARAMQLDGERVAIGLATRILDGGGRITSMTVSGDEAIDMATVSTSYMNYPPQMVTQIKTLFAARLTEIEGELVSLGVTGLAAR